MIAVFDIDGVLADARHREHHLAARPRDWDAFFSAVRDDPVLPGGRRRLLAEEHEHEIVLLSGRPERCRADTEAWLARHGMGSPRMLLRADSDHRPAPAVKADLIQALAAPEHVAIVLDDDASVVARLRTLGYRAEIHREDDPLR